MSPAKTQDIHRPLRTISPRLNDILCHREQRYVGAQLTFHYGRKQIILEQTEAAKGLEGQYKDQRVNHTAIVENKRLSHALAIVKAQQELKLATKVMTNSEKTGYKKRVRNVSEPSARSLQNCTPTAKRRRFSRVRGCSCGNDPTHRTTTTASY